MMSEVFYGRIKPDKLTSWNSNKEPYEIPQEKIEIRVGGWEFLEKAGELLREKTQVDWGSFAYKATKRDLTLLMVAKQAQYLKMELFFHFQFHRMIKIHTKAYSIKEKAIRIS